MRDYILDCGMDKERYLELCHFCRQYASWSHEMERIFRAGIGSTDPRYTTPLMKIRTIEKCAHAVDNGRWYNALISNICFRVPYHSIPACDLPSSNRNDFFTARKRFFLLLDRLRDRQHEANQEQPGNCPASPL